ncbi:heterokaryon incompatibility protein-domain-containing protein [Halenospora varia]|nr:heterokaryon incompatibility protein-domain-containing protein [Halenospora varia]
MDGQPTNLGREIWYSLSTYTVSRAFSKMLGSMVGGDSCVLGVETNDDCFGYRAKSYIMPIFAGSSTELPEVNFRQVRPDSINFDVLKGWILHCQAHHSRICEPLSLEAWQQVSGLRVMDCKERKIIEAPHNCAYVALSYVWGMTGQMQDPKEIRKDGNLPNDLPSTVGDAIEVVLRLNLRFLWIDKYCIDQSDENDKRYQISTMDMIYNWATVTIIAAAGNDSSHGLPGIAHRRRP